MSEVTNEKTQEFRNFKLSTTAKNTIIVLLILVSVAILGLLFANIFGTNNELVNLLDNMISLIFILLFIVVYKQSIDKSHFLHRNWWILIGALPVPTVYTNSSVINILLGLVLLTRFVIRLILLIRVSNRVIPRFYALQIVTMLSFFTLLSTELFYAAEHATNPQVQTHFDSFWWTMVTTTTVGYGDITPVTNTGRIIAIFMMLMGIGIVGLVTGSAASFLSKRIRTRYEKLEDDL